MTHVLVKCPSCHKGIRVVKKSDNQVLTCPTCNYGNSLSAFPPVTLRQVSCPVCSMRLTLNAEYRGAITCPGCKHQGSVQSFPGVVQANKRASSFQQQATSADVADPNKTSLKNKNCLLKPGTLVLTEGSCAPACITLKRGINVIGRKHEQSQSTIQFETADHYMSRKHANIDVVMKPDASFEHRLSDAESVNGTFHNEDRLSEGEVSILAPNDTIRIGRTTFKFIIE